MYLIDEPSIAVDLSSDQHRVPLLVGDEHTSSLTLSACRPPPGNPSDLAATDGVFQAQRNDLLHRPAEEGPGRLRQTVTAADGGEE